MRRDGVETSRWRSATRDPRGACRRSAIFPNEFAAPRERDVLGVAEAAFERARRSRKLRWGLIRIRPRDSQNVFQVNELSIGLPGIHFVELKIPVSFRCRS